MKELDYLEVCNIIRDKFTKKGYDICNIELVGQDDKLVYAKFKNVHWSEPTSMSVAYSYITIDENSNIVIKQAPVA